MANHNELKKDLKNLRKKLYIHQNRLLDIERDTRIAEFSGREGNINYYYARRHKRLKMFHAALDEEGSDVLAFVDSFPPLRNEYILEMIANHLPSQDLRNCRLVCRLWNKEMSRCLSARRVLIVTEPDCPNARNVLERIKEKRIVAVGHICLFDISSQAEIFKRLLNEVGQTLSGLKLEECDVTPQDLAKIFTRLSPNLESFSWKGEATRESQRESTFSLIQRTLEDDVEFRLPNMRKFQWDEEFGRVELLEIVNAFPNLLSLEFRNVTVPRSDLFKNVTWDSLHTLKLSPRDELQEELIIALKNLNLKIHTFQLFGIMPSNQKRMNALNDLLQSLSESLKDLELFQHFSIGRNTRNSNFSSPFPANLPHLTKLAVDFCLIQSTDFLDSLPQLRNLDCKADRANDWEVVSATRCFNRDNDNLSLLSLGSVNRNFLSKVASNFKMCTSLDVEPRYLCDEAIRVIFSGLPKLQQLRIAKLEKTERLSVTDSGITGLSLEQCDSVLDEETLSRRPFPAIFDLKDLMRLEICAQATLLTDLSVVEGIAKCSRLGLLVLPKCDISDLSINAIKGNNSLAMLEIPICPKLTKSVVDELRRVRKDIVFSYANYGVSGTY